jgi:hypothetical protein
MIKWQSFTSHEVRRRKWVSRPLRPSAGLIEQKNRLWKWTREIRFFGSKALWRWFLPPSKRSFRLIWGEGRGGERRFDMTVTFFLTRFVPLGWSSSSTSSHLLGLLTILVSPYLSSSSSSRARGRGKGEGPCENDEGFYFIYQKFHRGKLEYCARKMFSREAHY